MLIAIQAQHFDTSYIGDMAHIISISEQSNIAAHIGEGGTSKG